MSVNASAKRDAIWRRIVSLGGEGILSREQAMATNAAVLEVLALMIDGRWYSPSEIRRAAGFGFVEASEGLRRMRELRHVGWDVEKWQQTEGIWFYRIVKQQPKVVDDRPTTQGELW